MTIPSSSTQMRPVTESTVSINDQDLMVWPTEKPKYSLTSQNPASLTWEKNTEPEPMASTTSEVSPVLSLRSKLTIRAEAVIVATVAEPGARGTMTARSQASSSAEMLAPWAQSASRVPMPVSISTCLK